MSIVPASTAAAVASVLPALGNFLLEPKVAKLISQQTAQFIRRNAVKDETGAVMSRARVKMGAGSGYPMPIKNTKMLSTNSVVDYSGSSSSPVLARSSSAAYPIGYNGAPARRGRRAARRQRVPRNLSSYADKISTCFRASPALTNTSADSAGYAYSLGVVSNFSGIGRGPISLFLTQWSALAALYREFRITKITIDFVPRVASTVSGEVAVAIDRDPQAGLAGQQVLVRRNPFFQTDLKVPACLEWTPIDSKDREWRYTTLGTSRSEEFVSFGALLVATNNSGLVQGSIFGDLFINAWAEFAVPH